MNTFLLIIHEKWERKTFVTLNSPIQRGHFAFYFMYIVKYYIRIHARE